MKFILLLLLSQLCMSYAQAKNIDYKSEGKDYQGYMLSNDKNAPLVIIVHDWDGLTDYEIKRAEMLNKLGYSVFAVDLFGKGIRPKEIKEKKKLTGELYKNRKKMRAILNSSLQAAKKSGLNSKNAVIIGYCFGGAAILEFARSGVDLKGFVSFHGGLKTPEGQSYKTTKGNLLVLHGTADTSVTMNDFAGLATELEETKIPHEMITYSGAPHAFSVFGSKRYRKDADLKSWARFVEFLNKTTKKSKI